MTYPVDKVAWFSNNWGQTSLSARGPSYANSYKMAHTIFRSCWKVHSIYKLAGLAGQLWQIDRTMGITPVSAKKQILLVE